MNWAALGNPQMTDALQNGGAKKRATTKKSAGKKKAASPWNKFFAAFAKKNAGKIPHLKMMKAASVEYAKK